MDTRPVLGKLGSGQRVVNRYRSHIHRGVSPEILTEAFWQIYCIGVSHAVCEPEFDRIIGEATCVQTSKSDTIVYAKRRGQNFYTPFVLDREPEPCNKVVVILKKDTDDDVYVLLSAYIGKWWVPEPQNPKETRGSDLFWRTHALIWDQKKVVPGTETIICPW